MKTELKSTKKYSNLYLFWEHHLLLQQKKNKHLKGKQEKLYSSGWVTLLCNFIEISLYCKLSAYFQNTFF